MAGITYIRPATGSVPNPSNRHLPVNITGSFEDSSLIQDDKFQTASALQTIDNSGGYFGIIYDISAYKVVIGDYDLAFNQNYIEVNDLFSSIDVKCNFFTLTTNDIRIGGSVTAATAGGSSGRYLKVQINGIDYKIALLTP